jgi:hypothetical protein
MGGFWLRDKCRIIAGIENYKGGFSAPTYATSFSFPLSGRRHPLAEEIVVCPRPLIDR